MLPEDIKTLDKRGISQSTLESQISRFKTGFPFLRILDSARIDNGITILNAESQDKAIARWNKYLNEGGEVCKFVPASGAASRMFKALFEFLDSDISIPSADSHVMKFADGITRFAFFDDLNNACIKLHGKGVTELFDEKNYKAVVATLLKPEGLNYGNLPKGLIKFHSYNDAPRTPLEEHLMEGAQTATNKDGIVNLHFTVSPEHRALFEETIAKAAPRLEELTGVKYNISLSEQKKSTDTVAVNPDNTLFRENGELLFRPGGHGALIENLNDIDSSVVFIKNIDNVVPDSHRSPTLQYKKVLGGYLMQVYDHIEEYIKLIDSGKYSIEQVRQMISFMHDVLNIRDEKMKHLEDADLVLYIKEKLNRPIRVCGMVRNEGEPGGGPYIAYNADGSTSPQILESTQIDSTNESYKEMVARATHFNPVDLVCYIKDIEGKKFDLPTYVDPDTGFISSKSKNGKTLRALELPGLWNGAMSDWNTIFVEVPIETFNPVKTVNDLLRPSHQE